MSAAGVAPARETTILTIDGLTEAIALYDDLYDDLLELEPILRDAAGTMAAAARLNVRSRTYRLVASIVPLSTGATAEVVSQSVYAEVQEWGWPAMHIPAQNYAVRAIASDWPTVQRDAEAAIQKMVDALGVGEGEA
jgi:hypothetical protein